MPKPSPKKKQGAKIAVGAKEAPSSSPTKKKQRQGPKTPREGGAGDAKSPSKGGAKSPSKGGKKSAGKYDAPGKVAASSPRHARTNKAGTPTAREQNLARRKSDSKLKDAPKKKDKKRRRDKTKKPSGWHMFKKWLFPNSMAVIDLDGEAEQMAFELGLTQRQLKKLKREFDFIDIDLSGEIDMEEFFEFVHEPKNVFSTSLFSLIDTDGSGNISFEEFVASIGTYCMFTKDDILNFIFDIFDEDKSGTLDDQEFVKMSAGVNNGDPSWVGNFRTAMENFDVNKDGLIDFGEFKMINKMYPLVMFPAFRLQDKMQKHTLGEKGWVKLHTRRHAIENLRAYMSAHLGALPPESVGTKISNFLTGNPGVRALSRAILDQAKRNEVQAEVPED